MNRKETAERIKIMQAFVDGKQIEFTDCMGRWCEAKNPSWNWDSERKYRIKPEPKYRPFKDADECWQEMQKHKPFGWFIEKTKDGEPKERFMLTCVSDSHPEIKTNEYLFKDCTFEDGSICGVLVEE